MLSTNISFPDLEADDLRLVLQCSSTKNTEGIYKWQLEPQPRHQLSDTTTRRMEDGNITAGTTIHLVCISPVFVARSGLHSPQTERMTMTEAV